MVSTATMNGKVYLISWNNPATGGGLAYVGSTTMTMKKRMSCHNVAYNRYLNNQGGFCSVYSIYDQVRMHGGLVPSYLVLWSGEVESKQELRQKEEEMKQAKIDDDGFVYTMVNIRKERGKSLDDFDSKEEYMSDYYEENKEAFKQRFNQWKQANPNYYKRRVECPNCEKRIRVVYMKKHKCNPQ